MLHALVLAANCVAGYCTTTTQIVNSTTTAAPFTVPTLFGNFDPNQVIVSLTLAWLALLAIFGFIFGLVSSVMIVLYKRRFGVVVKVIAEIGISYKEVYQKLVSEWKTEFRHKNRMYAINLARTAWLDYANRPVLIYEKETATPVDVTNTTVKLKAAVKQLNQEAMKIRMTKDGKKPADPFDLLFGRKAMEALVRAQKRVQGHQGIAISLLVLLLGVMMGYLAGNFLPFQAHTVVVQANSTTITHTITGVSK